VTQIPTWSGGPVNTPNGRADPAVTIGGRYSLRAAVGHGGMGTVWRAADTLLRRDVAVKEVVLPPGLAPSDRDALYERTLREARAAAALQHPAVVQVYDVVTEGGRPWIVMELLDARSLADMVIEDGPLDPRAVAKIGIALLGALEVAHAIGVLHRDVKPANVLICTDGRCVLTDFGVARMPTDVQLTTPGMVLGSPHFISPERAMGQDFGPPSDLFSLGVTLYTAVEGRPPFDKGDPIETMHAVVEDPPAPPVKSGPLTRVLLGLLEKDPARRLDVNASRSMLRDLLAGPLASKAPTDQLTDPYAVVPTQRPPWQPPAEPAEPQPTGQIGGRAMLAPGESLTDRLAELRRGDRKSSAKTPGGFAAAALDETNPGGAPGASRPGDSTGAHTTALSMPTGAMSSPPGAPPGPWHVAGAQHGGPGAHSASGTPSYAAQGGPGAPYGTQQGGPGGHHAAHGAHGAMSAPTGVLPTSPWGANRPPGGQSYGTPAPAAGGGLGRATTGARRVGGNLVTTVRGWPRNVQLAAAGGVAVVLVLGAVLLFNGSDPSTPPPQAGAGPTPAAPVIETQPYADRGLSINVPKGWKKGGAGSYVDYTDPQDSGRRVRIIVEGFKGGESHHWAEVAENGLKKNSKSCARPYARLAFNDVDLAGKPAAEFEYNCGQGDSMRHGVWRGVVRNDHAYSFYLTSTDTKFGDSKAIFDEMVKSFQFTDAG
jgi:serine/threonine protein kinase